MLVLVGESEAGELETAPFEVSAAWLYMVEADLELWAPGAVDLLEDFLLLLLFLTLLLDFVADDVGVAGPLEDTLGADRL